MAMTGPLKRLKVLASICSAEAVGVVPSGE
jgi:hypothetical protein